MNTQDENRDFVQSQYFDPFPEPQTIPSGWDTSGFFSAPRADTVTASDDSAESGTQVNM
jgi:hypothetical protein